MSIGRVLSNRYELKEKVGSGGMANVYRAYCRYLKRDVAVKILKTEFNDDKYILDQFKQESESAAILPSHPNIVNIYDVGIDQELHYYVMEFVEGQTLRALIDDNKTIDFQKACKYTIDIANALDATHQKSIIHGDVKPLNILLDNSGNAKITDFGIAHAVATNKFVQQQDAVLGSVHYMSPEQVNNGVVDSRSDIYSLGITLYEMVTGSLPFKGSNAVSVALMQLNDEPKAPIIVNPNIPSMLNFIILKAMNKKPSARYQNTNDLIHDIEEFINNPDSDYAIDMNANDVSTDELTPLVFDKENLSQPETQIDNMRPFYKKRRFWVRATLAIIPLTIAALFLIIFGRMIIENNFSKDFYTLPNLVDLPVEDAERLLNNNDLLLAVGSTKTSDTISEGNVIASTPVEGSRVKAGSVVIVDVSAGSATVLIPSLIGLPKDEAVEMLHDIGLTNIIFDEVENQAQKDFVLEQSIMPSTEIEDIADTTIILTLSKGVAQNTVVVGDYSGYSITTATELIENSGMQVGSVTQRYQNDVNKNTVYEQSISPGTEVKKSTVIDLYISAGPPPLYERTLTIFLPDGSPDTPINVRVVDITDNSKEVHNQDHVLGEITFDLPLSEHGSHTYQIYFDGVMSHEETINFYRRG